ncbi:MAG: radical SAM protein [Bacteroidia bacterium]|nr:radical SAM protein [Bacteroidia bacterium]
MSPLSDMPDGTLTGGFSNFPKTRDRLSPEELEAASRQEFGKLKASRFNSFIPFEGKIVGFNSYTQKFLVLESELLDLFNAGVIENNLPGIAEIHPDFFFELKKNEFIIEDNTDELQKVKDLRNATDFNEKRYELVINPTMNCNFKCWYCYESHIKGSKMDSETMLKIINHIDHVIENQPELEELDISWFGGEPMLYFDHVIKPIVKHAYEKCQEHGIEFTSDFTTNGYLVKEEMIPFFQKYNINSFQITLDGEKEKHNTVRYTANKKGSYDSIIKNIKLLVKGERVVSVRVNYVEETLDKIENIIEDFKDLTEEEKSYMMVSFHNVWQDSGPHVEKLEKVVTNFWRNDFYTNSFFNTMDSLRSSCYADKKNHATINYDGEVFKCTARNFDEDGVEGKMTDEGKIQWNEKFDKRMNSKFKNSPCLSCRIQPICNGGCSQQALEQEGLDYCVVEDSGLQKDEVIMARFKQILESQIVRRARLVKKINKELIGA